MILQIHIKSIFREQIFNVLTGMINELFRRFLLQILCMHKLRFFLGTFILLMTSALCFGWGFLVHRTVAQLSVYQLPKEMRPFFYMNMNYLVTESIGPDVRRNSDPSENPKHFIDAENYGDSALWKMPLRWDDAVRIYSKDTLMKYGYVPYQVIMMKEKLTQAFRDKNKD